MSEQAIITTPLIEDSVELLRNCSATESLGAIIGGNGTGKTWALKALERRYKSLNLPGEVFRYRCCPIETGATRGVRDLLIEMGCGGAALMNGASASVQLLSKIALREFTQRNLRCLLLDEADLWNTSTLGGLLALYDICREKDHPVVMILAGAERADRWIGALPAMRSRTLHIVGSSNFEPDMMRSVLQQWTTPLADLVAKFDSGEKVAGKVLAKIHKGTAGNFRRLRFFMELSRQEPERKIDSAFVDEIFARMQNQ